MKKPTELHNNPRWQKVVCLDWDMTVNSAISPDFSQASKTPCVVPVHQHLGTIFKILQANGVKVISLSQRNMYNKGENELQMRRRMTEAMDTLWGVDRTFLQTKEVEFIGDISTENESFKTKNAMIAKIKDLPGCNEIKSSDFIVVDDSVQYFAPAEGLNYQCLHVRRTWSSDYHDFQPFLRLLHLACPTADIEAQITQHCTDSVISEQLHGWWKTFCNNLTAESIIPRIQPTADEKTALSNFSWIADHFEFLTPAQKEQSEKTAMDWIELFVKTRTSIFESILMDVRGQREPKPINLGMERQLIDEEINHSMVLLHVKKNKFSECFKKIEKLTTILVKVENFLSNKSFFPQIAGHISKLNDEKLPLIDRLNSAKILIKKNAVTEDERSLSVALFETYFSSFDELLNEITKETAEEKHYHQLEEKLPEQRKITEFYSLSDGIMFGKYSQKINLLSAKTDNFIRQTIKSIGLEFGRIKDEKSTNTLQLFKSQKAAIEDQEKLLNFLSKLATAFGSESIRKELLLSYERSETLMDELHRRLMVSSTDEKITPKERAGFRWELFNEFKYTDKPLSEKIFDGITQLDMLGGDYQKFEQEVISIPSTVLEFAKKLSAITQALRTDMSKFSTVETLDTVKHISDIYYNQFDKSEKLINKLVDYYVESQKELDKFITDCFTNFQHSILSESTKNSPGLFGAMDQELLSAFARVSANKNRFYFDITNRNPEMALPQNKSKLIAELTHLFLTTKIGNNPSVQEFLKKPNSKSVPSKFLSGLGF